MKVDLFEGVYGGGWGCWEVGFWGEIEIVLMFIKFVS